MGNRRLTGTLIVLATALALTPAAEAAFPGENGKIAFVSFRDGNAEIHSVNPDGTANTNLTNDPAVDSDPAWSPDGTRIAFVSTRDDPNGDIYIMMADGSGVQRITSNLGYDLQPAWSPDGTQIAFMRPQLWVMDADGANQTQLTTGDRFPEGVHGPAWSPDGNRIAFGGVIYGEDHAYWFQWLMRPDGTGLDPIFENAESANWHPNSRTLVMDEGPGAFRIDIYGGDYFRYGGLEYRAAWSPDGMKIAFIRETPTCCGFRLYTMNGADGSGVAQLVPDSVASWREGSPDWQPIPVNAYPRPRAASPIQVSLVPAYEPCTAPDRTHGPPLSFDSCSAPEQTSGQLTVGTPDANGQGPRSTSTLWLRVQPGIPSTPADEADIGLSGTVNDVRLASDLSDYTGSLEARVTLRITDKDSTPHPGGPGAATTADIPYSFPIPCAATANTAIGAECTFDTTAEAFLPGIAKEGGRAVWQLSQMAIHDAAGDVFMRQGVFVP